MERITLNCHDGFHLAGYCWKPVGVSRATVIVNSATGVLARYYARYAAFLAEHGFTVLTFDYRGIGGSRPARLRTLRMRWRDWGELDFEAAVNWARQRDPDATLAVVGHSIGGFLPGFAASAPRVDRMLTVGAQYAYWPDYASAHRLGYWLKWHLVMPALTALYGYFPGRRLGWLEDLPAGVAYEWGFRRARMEVSYPQSERESVLARFAAVRAPILAVSMSDDPFATPRAVNRALGYYRGSERTRVVLRPDDLGQSAVGHFDLFHDRHRATFWRQTLDWIGEGANPWSPAETLPVGSGWRPGSSSGLHKP